jgi:hypothetical protein
MTDRNKNKAKAPNMVIKATAFKNGLNEAALQSESKPKS